jgi:tRNA1(Val) A37 N6-methylase TrmN6
MKQKSISLMTDAGTTSDTLLGGKVLLMQPAIGYRSAIDAVFLAAAVDANFGTNIADLGAGAGASSLCLAWRMPEANITGYEAAIHLCELAQQNAERNGYSSRLRIHQADVTNTTTLPEDAFDQVISNPPFYLAGSGTPSSDLGRDQSLRIDAVGLANWVKAMAKVLRHHGRATFIYSVEWIDLLISELRARFGGLCLFPLWQRHGSPAKRVLVQARKGSKTSTTFLSGMVLHTSGGRYTPEAEAVLRHGAAIDLGG